MARYSLSLHNCARSVAEVWSDCVRGVARYAFCCDIDVGIVGGIGGDDR